MPCGFVIAGCGAPSCSNLQCSSFDRLQMKPAQPLVFRRMYTIKPVLSALKDNSTTIVQRREIISTVLLCGASILLGQLGPSIVPAIAEENNKTSDNSGGGDGSSSIVDGVLSLFDPDQMTKSGKKLPKKYVKSVKEVVKSLRESFNEDTKDNAKFRRNADSAKEAIREYLQDWRGAKVVATEDSYIALESAFRILGEFYSKKGPQAALPEDIRTRVLEDLSKADDSI